MKNKLIIISHTGTSVKETINSEFWPLKEELEQAKGHKTVMTFTSQRPIDKLADKDFYVQHTEKMLIDAVEAYESIDVLAPYLVESKGYNMALNSCKKVSEIGISKVVMRINEPLLANESDVKHLALAINKILGEEDKHIIFIGCEKSENGQKYYDRFMACYHELNEAISFYTLGEELHSPLDVQGKEVLLFPLVTISGHHIAKALFEDPTSLYQQLRQKGIKVSKHENGLMAYPEIREIIIKSIDVRM